MMLSIPFNLSEVIGFASHFPGDTREHPIQYRGGVRRYRPDRGASMQ